MTVVDEMNKLIAILDEKGKFTHYRIHAVLSGDMGRARFIEEQIYPEYNRRINSQIKLINKVWGIKEDAYGR